MGKSKNKGFKMAVRPDEYYIVIDNMLKWSVSKKKKVAPEKFLVVVNAWGLNQRGDFDVSDFNNIGAWFELMLREGHPGVGIQALYYQRAHRNIIIELPREVKDITNYLGRHYYSQFLTHSPHSEKYAEIYEYKYSVHGDPGEKNWSIGYPTYKEIPKGIPLTNPYPCPGHAGPPPIDVADYAYPVPPVVYERRLERLALELQSRSGTATANTNRSTLPATPESSRQACTSSQNEVPSGNCTDKGKDRMVDLVPGQSRQKDPETLFSPYSGPSHLTTTLKASISVPNSIEISVPIIKKIDPYEDEELAKRSLSTTKGIKDEAENFLLSVMGQPDDQEDEKPPLSSEIDEDDYEPSTELLALLRTLPPELTTEDTTLQEEFDHDDKSDVKIKPEPMDDSIPEYEPSEELLETLSSLPQSFLSSENDSRQNPYVKNEFEDHIESETVMPFKIKQEPRSEVLVKSEPVDDNREFDFQSRNDWQGTSPDPRIRRQKKSSMSENKRRYSPMHSGFFKRVKTEDS